MRTVKEITYELVWYEYTKRDGDKKKQAAKRLREQSKKKIFETY